MALNRIPAPLAGLDSRVATVESTAITKASIGAVLATDTQFAGGAKFDGTTDDTAALQAFITYIVVNGRRGVMPAGTAKITGTLQFSYRPGWELVGAGRLSTIIKQYTDNIPILNLGSDTASFMHTWKLADFSLDYANVQPYSNANANCILMSQMAYQGQMLNLGFLRGSYAIRTGSGVQAPWGNTWNDLVFGSGLTGGAMDWSPSANGGIPNNLFGRILADCANMVGPVFSVRGYNFTVGAIEFLNGNLSPVLFRLAAGGQADIGAMKLELGTLTVPNTNLFDFGPNCYVRIGQLEVNDPLVINPGAGNAVTLIAIGPSTPGVARVDIGRVHVSASAFTSGAAYVAQAGPGSSINIATLVMLGGWQLQNNGSTDGGDRITVADHQNNRVSPNKGDANYTVVQGDPTIVMFQTAFTASRTITLPGTGENLFNGLYYEINVNGAINGANTLVIKSGATTLRTQTVDKTVLRYTWRRHATATAGWVLTQYQTLP